MDPKNKVRIFVGYSDDVKGYRAFYPDTNKVEIHRDVITLPDVNKQTKETVRDSETVVMLDITAEDEVHDENKPAIENPENMTESLEENEEPSDLESREEETEDVSESTRFDTQGRELRKPSWLKDYDTSSSFFTAPEEPISGEEVISGGNTEKRKEAMKKELSIA